VHLLVSLFGRRDSAGEFKRRLAQLAAFWARPGLRLVGDPFRAETLPGGRVHFGYRDGLTNPRIAGVPDNGKADLQPRCSVGEVLLGENYPSVYGGPSLDGMPAHLCENGTFAVVRIMEQDVAGFERLLKNESARLGMDPELLAAKMMGRWRDGRPLNRTETGGDNDFDYAPTHANPEIFDDHEGLRCPIGSHVRRMNPRSAVVAGRPHSRRLIRRGMAYGPAWREGEHPPARRGLFGLFICADIARQFDFLMQSWANDDIAASNVRGTQDPIIGAQNLTGQFRFPTEARGTVTMSVPRLVTTRGSLYLLMPGHGGLRYLASLEGGSQ
jgi:deferrochelatase/peroxidase EfeB